MNWENESAGAPKRYLSTSSSASSVFHVHFVSFFLTATAQAADDDFVPRGQAGGPVGDG